MDDITAELAALHEIPKHPDYTALRSWDRETERANYYQRRCAYFEGRLALAERLLRIRQELSHHEYCDVIGLKTCTCGFDDARAYLAHRAKEQP